MRAIMQEVRAAADLTLENDGLLLRFDPNNLLTAYMVIVGLSGTPYEHCFFLFDISLARNHPESPPRLTYLTNDGRTRFNPNLYKNGHVCLSILGTWRGPGWKMCTIESVGRAIQLFVLTATPLRCEPGFNGANLGAIAGYSQLVEYQSMRFSIVKAIENPPPGFAEFRPQLIQYFADHMDFFMAKLAWLQANDEGKIFDIYMNYTVTCTARYHETAKMLIALYAKLMERPWVKTGEGGFDPSTRIWNDPPKFVKFINFVDSATRIGYLVLVIVALLGWVGP
jgi:ubiquitin-protein ligase